VKPRQEKKAKTGRREGGVSSMPKGHTGVSLKIIKTRNGKKLPVTGHSGQDQICSGSLHEAKMQIKKASLKITRPPAPDASSSRSLGFSR